MVSRRNKRSRSSCPAGWVPAGYRVPVRFTVAQERYSRRAIGITRFVYNLCVATHQFCRTNRLPWPSWQDLYKEFNACKRADYPFATEVASRVAEGAFMEFGSALRNWRDPKLKARAPTFKRKSRTGTGSYRAASGVSQCRYGGKRRITLPGLGSVKLCATLPTGIVHEAHISWRNGRWMLSVKYWKPPTHVPVPDERIPAGAVDTGINPHATDSEGQTWQNPKAYYRLEGKIRRWHRAQSRRSLGSRGWRESQRKLDRLHRRLVGIRGNAQHQMTSQLVHKFQTLVVEDLNVSGMMRGLIPKAQADAGMGEIKRQLVYKGRWHHCQVELASRFFPSSKTCSNCSFVHAKLKRERYWQCPSCNTLHDRNLNAAVNLRALLTLPPGRGMILRDGRALAAGTPDGETIPNDRRTATRESAPAPLTVCGLHHQHSLTKLNVHTP